MEEKRRTRDKIPETDVNRRYDMLVDNDKTSLGVLRRMGLETRPSSGHESNNPLHGTVAGSKVYDGKKMYVSQDEMARWRLPLYRRDYCAHKYIEYLKCTRDMYYCPWKCGDEQHAVEHCLTNEFAEREVAAKKFRNEL